MSISAMESKKSKAAPCSDLLREFSKNRGESGPGVKLKFLDIEEGEDVYNITPPFFIDGIEVIAGRVEKREDSARSRICFFVKHSENVWTKIDDTKNLPLEDPFVSEIQGKLVLGGVAVEHIPPMGDKPASVIFWTNFYKVENLQKMEALPSGPEGMKDIRMLDLQNGRIGVFTRPRLGKYGPGQIGYIEISNLAELNADKLLEANIIEGLFLPTEWGGANQLHLLEGGKIGVIGHIACRDAGDKRHYYATSFIFDPQTRRVASSLKIIAVRDNFPKGEAKRPDLEDVIFSGGIKKEGEQWYLYAGLSDVEAGKIPIEDPF